MRGLLAVMVVVGSICVTTAILDMGMNGAASAEWAPWGLSISLICFVFVMVFGPPAVY